VLELHAFSGIDRLFGDLMKPYVVCVFLILFIVACAFSQSPPQSSAASGTSPNTFQSFPPDLKDKIKKLAGLQKNFGEKMNSAGVELSLKEISRSHPQDRTLVTYALYASGFRPDARLTLFQVQIDGPIIKNLEGITLNAAGQAICAGQEGTCSGNGPNDPIDLVLYAGTAEPKRFALISDDNAHAKGFVSVVPFPNIAVDNGCRLESIIGTPNGELTFILGTGFEPNAAIIMDGQSYDEKHHDVSKAQADGSYFAAIAPGVLGKKSGVTLIEIKSSKCNPKLTFRWGENTYQLQ
jgi:hypothetical protein